MGHAGAIISGGEGTAAEKMAGDVRSGHHCGQSLRLRSATPWQRCWARHSVWEIQQQKRPPNQGGALFLLKPSISVITVEEPRSQKDHRHQKGELCVPHRVQPQTYKSIHEPGSAAEKPDPCEISHRLASCITPSVMSLLLAVFTVIAMLVLLVPTMIWVRLRAQWAGRFVEFLCLLPLTIPALVIVVGLRNGYRGSLTFSENRALAPDVRVCGKLALPFAYRALRFRAGRHRTC